MPLTSGTRLGTYEITGHLGSGGMGEVYRARDTKLGREVAIKVMPDEMARDAERLARFEREARVLAALNHGNIATLYGSETDAGTGFLVMELVEGETLADRIARGPLPVGEALPLFLQIAEGLEAAHVKGVIHRDLKPANLKVTPDGVPKILDFGLAKAFAPEAAGSGDAALSASPTLTLQATRRGEILGTAAYMSPEQVRGLESDPRADVWGFGCCLYEALTGRRPFSGEDAAQTLASVLKDGHDRIALLDSWKSGHTGFSAHNRVTVAADDAPGLERMARYLLRPPCLSSDSTSTAPWRATGTRELPARAASPSTLAICWPGS